MFMRETGWPTKMSSVWWTKRLRTGFLVSQNPVYPHSWFLFNRLRIIYTYFLQNRRNKSYKFYHNNVIRLEINSFRLTWECLITEKQIDTKICVNSKICFYTSTRTREKTKHKWMKKGNGWEILDAHWFFFICHQINCHAEFYDIWKMTMVRFAAATITYEIATRCAMSVILAVICIVVGKNGWHRCCCQHKMMVYLHKPKILRWFPNVN